MDKTYASVDDDGVVTGFFSEEWHSDEIPAGAIEITSETYAQLIAAQELGETIKVSSDGHPLIIPISGMNEDQTAMSVLASRDQLLRDAALRIAPLQDAVDLDEATDAEIALLKKWKQYRVALNRIQDQAGYPAEITWPAAPEA